MRRNRDLIRKAVAGTWEKESAVRFSGWRTCSENGDGIRIALETRFPQTRGRGVGLDGKANGMILPSLWNLADLTINLKAPVHEFGHALGFGHEYARPDAPDLANCSPQADTGSPYIEHDTPLTYFDRDSIMVACTADATVRFSRGTPKPSAADIFGLIGVNGSNPSNILDIDEPGDRFGAALALDDLNEDGTPDLIVATPGEDDGKGAFYVFTGDELSGFRPWIKRDMADRDIEDPIGETPGTAASGKRISSLDEVDAESWLQNGDDWMLFAQTLFQRDGCAATLLLAERRDDEGPDEPRFR